MLPSRLLLTAGRCRASEASKQSSPEACSSLAGIPRDSGQAEDSHRAPLPSHLMMALQEGGEGGGSPVQGQGTRGEG